LFSIAFKVSEVISNCLSIKSLVFLAKSVLSNTSALGNSSTEAFKKSKI